MKTSLLMLAIALVSVGGLLFFFSQRKPANKQALQMNTSPNLPANSVATSLPTPQSFNYDKTTNLQEALDTVNPQVEGKDFESIEKLLPSL